jgi:hypothetical protein
MDYGLTLPTTYFLEQYHGLLLDYGIVSGNNASSASYLTLLGFDRSLDYSAIDILRTHHGNAAYQCYQDHAIHLAV